jgi:tagatose 1,6-diphosphate aldolase
MTSRSCSSCWSTRWQGDAHQTSDYVEMTGKRTDHVLQSVADFAHPDYGIDVFKLESPVAAKDVPVGGDWQETQAAFDEMGRLAGRPWVMLSAGAGKADFRNILAHAYRAGASGLSRRPRDLARAVQPLPGLGCDAQRARNRDPSTTCAISMRSPIRRPCPGTSTRCSGPEGAHFTPADQSFRHSYSDFG